MTDLAVSSTPLPLYPPTVKPPLQPLPLWRFLPTFVRNPLRAIPEQVYHLPMFSPDSLGGRMAWVTDPALVEEILLGNHEAFPKSPIEKRIFESMIGDGILTSEGALWRWQRHAAAPLFRHGEVLSYVPAMTASARNLVARWQEGPPAGKRRIDHDMTDVTFDVLAATIFAGATEPEARILKTAIGFYLGATSWDIAYEILQVPQWVWHPGKRTMQREADRLVSTMQAIVRRQRELNWSGGGLMARLASARHPETGTPMSDEQMTHNLLTFAAAGHETTAKALTWALYLLARAPEWQERLRAEVSRVAGDEAIAASHVSDLVITRQVIKEAMRLYPPAPVMGRMARHSVEVGGRMFADGSMLVIPIFVIHRHRALWEDPDRFDPTRFESDKEKAMKRTQFMPFGFGPRTCIGMSFAMIEAVVLLAELMRNTRLSVDSRHLPEPQSRVTLRPKGGVTLTVDIGA